jgi:hypothetical protein
MAYLNNEFESLTLHQNATSMKTVSAEDVAKYLESFSERVKFGPEDGELGQGDELAPYRDAGMMRHVGFLLKTKYKTFEVVVDKVL